MKIASNTLRTGALSLCMLALAAAPAFAQDNGGPPPQGGYGQGGPAPGGYGQGGPGGGPGYGGPGGPGGGGDWQADRLTRALNLSPAQQAQVEQIHENMMRQEHEQVRAILNDGQRARYDRMIGHMRRRREEGGQPGGQPGPGSMPPPPPQQ